MPPVLETWASRLEGVLAQAATFALGESRVREAFPVLKSFWQRTLDPDLSRSALLGIAMLRHDEAIDWLLTLVASEPRAHSAGCHRSLRDLPERRAHRRARAGRRTTRRSRPQPEASRDPRLGTDRQV